jgi:uncharacterized protein with HEPN domain
MPPDANVLLFDVLQATIRIEKFIAGRTWDIVDTKLPSLRDHVEEQLETP